MRSMKKFLKKMLLSVEKPIWPIFSGITEYGRAQLTNFYAPQGIMAINVQFIRSFP